MTTDLVDRIIAYEQGDMDREEMVEFLKEPPPYDKPVNVNRTPARTRKSP